MFKKVLCSEFVKRQTKSSGYSHYEGTWEELEEIVASSMSNEAQVRKGYREGVLLVDICEDFLTTRITSLVSFAPSILWSSTYKNMFYSSIIKIDDKTKLSVRWAPRLKGESSYLRIAAKAKKQPAIFATVVLYHKDILIAEDERSNDAEYEIIAIKARVSKEEEPMDPYTMARNFLELKGGTKGDFTAEQFAKSIIFWNEHCMVEGKYTWWKRLFKWLKIKG